MDADVLLLPELNYGGVLLILVATAWAARPSRGRPGPAPLPAYR